MGKKKDLSAVLVSDEIYTDSSKGTRASSEKLLKAFKTEDPIEIAEKLDLIQNADAGQLKQWVEKVIASMPEKVTEYKKGKKGLIGLFVGEVKKISKGKADPKIVTQILEEILNQN